MGYGAESSILGIVAAVIGIVLILTVVLRMWKKVPQDKAGVVTGMKKELSLVVVDLLYQYLKELIIYHLEIFHSVWQQEVVFQARVYQSVL